MTADSFSFRVCVTLQSHASFQPDLRCSHLTTARARLVIMLTICCGRGQYPRLLAITLPCCSRTFHCSCATIAAVTGWRCSTAMTFSRLLWVVSAARSSLLLPQVRATSCLSSCAQTEVSRALDSTHCIASVREIMLPWRVLR